MTGCATADPDAASACSRWPCCYSSSLPLAVGCVRVRASITVSPDDTVSGQIIAAAKPRDDQDKGPQFDDDLPFAQKVAVSAYDQDGYVGSEAVFSELSFAELPQLANMNRDAAGVDLSLRRAGNLVILEGRVDLTSVNDQEAEVGLTVSFPGEVTSTNGDRIDTDVVEWKLKPGIVNTMSAQARYTDPSTRSFTGGATVLGISALLVAGARRRAGLAGPGPLAAAGRVTREHD